MAGEGGENRRSLHSLRSGRDDKGEVEFLQFRCR